MYSKTQSSLWKSLKRKEISDDGKLLFIYLYSCPHRNLLGFYHIPFAYIESDLGWTAQRVSKGYAELYGKGLVEYDEGLEYMLIPGFLEHNPFENPNVEKKAVRLFEELSELAESRLLPSFERVLKGLPKPFPELLKRVTQTLSNKEEEEETEEETEEEVLCAEPETVSAPEPVITITLNDKSEYPVLPEQVKEWRELYPAVDVEQELRNMRGWCMSNPSKRKTKGGVLKFITGWLSREQDKGGVRASPSSRRNAPPSVDNRPSQEEMHRKKALLERMRSQEGDDEIHNPPYPAQQ